MLERAPADRYCLCVNRDDETLRGYCLSASRQLHKDATPRPRNSSFASPDCYVSSFASPDCFVGTERTFRHWCGVLAGIDAGLEPSAMTDYFRLLAGHFRARAEDIFARAERVRDADIREKMRGIAVGYEKMAGQPRRPFRPATAPAAHDRERPARPP